jgi:anaerobic ribonucleoside-triphosphate reductase
MQVLATQTPAVSSAAMTLDNSERTRCEIWTRVMGYHRPVSSFNTGKQGEFNERRFFVEKQSA